MPLMLDLRPQIVTMPLMLNQVMGVVIPATTAKVEAIQELTVLRLVMAQLQEGGLASLQQ
ncbi:MAG TPA: hypothetical protein DHW77_05805 [Verrucomicrobiales bacterium]|nr:hypothetical protein [Verrucomicrobiales bacterium]